MSAENPASPPGKRRPPALSSTRGRKPREVHDRDQVQEAIGELTTADLERLMIRAKTLLGGFRIDPKQHDHQDLLSEAVTRTLSGQRQWFVAVDLARHLFQTMRSIASHWRREALRKKLEPTLESLEDHPNLLDPRPNPEAALIIRETLEAIHRHFADDAAATAVLECMAKGQKGPAIRQATGMTQRQLATTIERIRRFARREYDDVRGIT